LSLNVTATAESRQRQHHSSGNYRTHLCHHPENASIIPNELVRCALFRVADPASPRRSFSRHRLPVQASRNGYIEYSGEELRQDDRRVFMHALHREGDTPGAATFRPRRFCEDIGWGTSNAAYEKLIETLTRLKATSLLMFVPRIARAGVAVSLIARWEFVPDSKEIRVYFDREIAELFRDQHYTRILRVYEDRLTRRSYLASWLLGFYVMRHTANPSYSRSTDCRAFAGT
jgi:hypothetical protein